MGQNDGWWYAKIDRTGQDYNIIYVTGHVVQQLGLSSRTDIDEWYLVERVPLLKEKV